MQGTCCFSCTLIAAIPRPSCQLNKLEDNMSLHGLNATIMQQRYLLPHGLSTSEVHLQVSEG